MERLVQRPLTRLRVTRRTAILAACGVGLAACGGGSSGDATRNKVATSQAAAGIARQATAVATAPPVAQVCLVSRERGLPAEYAPADLAALPRDYCLGDNIRLRAEATRAAIKLIDAAWEEEHKI